MNVKLIPEESYREAMEQTVLPYLAEHRTSGTFERIPGEFIWYELYNADAQKADIVIIPPGISHRPLLPDTMQDPFVRDVLWISTDFINKLCDTIPEIASLEHTTPNLFRATGTRWEYICDLFHQGVQETTSSQLGWQLMVQANTITILIHLIRANHDLYAKPLKAEKPELLDRITNYVEKHYAQPITIGDLAKAVQQLFGIGALIGFALCSVIAVIYTKKKRQTTATE